MGAVECYLDPLYTAAKTMMYNFQPEGTKFNFGEHAITFDMPSKLQFVWRTLSWAGSSDLIALATPLCHTILLLDPNQNPSMRVPCLLIWRALYALAEKTYSQDASAKELIHSKLVRMFKNAFEGRHIVPEDFRARAYLNSPLLNLSIHHWTSGNAASWEKIVKLFMKATAQALRSEDFTESLNKIERHLETVPTKIKAEISDLKRGLAGSVTPQSLDKRVSLDMNKVFAKKKSKADLKTIHTFLWPMWFATLADTHPARKAHKGAGDYEDFWTVLGISHFDSAENQRVPPAAFWEWVGLPLPEGESSEKRNSVPLEVKKLDPAPVQDDEDVATLKIVEIPLSENSAEGENSVPKDSPKTVEPVIKSPVQNSNQGKGKGKAKKKN